MPQLVSVWGTRALRGDLVKTTEEVPNEERVACAAESNDARRLQSRSETSDRSTHRLADGEETTEARESRCCANYPLTTKLRSIRYRIVHCAYAYSGVPRGV